MSHREFYVASCLEYEITTSESSEFHKCESESRLCGVNKSGTAEL